MSRAALLGTCVFVIAGLSGCATPAKVIQRDANSVVVAIPEKTNTWPWYYEDEAKKAAAAEMPDAVLVGHSRVKVGEQMTNRQDTTRRDINKEKSTIGEITSSLSTTSVSDTYEYHLVFERMNKSDTPNFSKAKAPAPPIPDGAPLVTPVGGVIAPKEPTGRIDMPANDVRMPTPPPGSPTSLPSTTLPTPGVGGGYPGR